MAANGIPDPTREKLLDAALDHVIFDGWSPETFAQAISDSGTPEPLARIAAPRGALDLASAYHVRGDRSMLSALEQTGLEEMKMREKIAHAIWVRLQQVDREIVQKSMSLYALPHLAPEGTRLLWETSDTIWTALGDSSKDMNWYTKRMTLSSVLASTILFWIGDESADNSETLDFIGRRIENVMQFEKLKASTKNNKILSKIFNLPNLALQNIQAPAGTNRDDLPGTQ